MSRKVLHLRRPRPAAEEPPWAGKRLPRVLPRALTVDIAKGQKALKAACTAHLRLLDKYEPRLTVQVAKIMHDGLPPVEEWAGAIVSFPGDPDDVVVVPRSQCIEAARDWPKIQEALREPAVKNRLDVFVYAKYIGTVLAIELEPALPVIRKEAEAANLPPNLLFAKGKAFVSVANEPAKEEDLLAAWKEHRKLLQHHGDDLLDELSEMTRERALAECAGVILAMGEGGEAVSVITRDKAKKLLAHEPGLMAKLESMEPGDETKLKVGSEGGLRVVVWAKGHVSVQTMRVRAVKRG